MVKSYESIVYKNLSWFQSTIWSDVTKIDSIIKNYQHHHLYRISSNVKWRSIRISAFIVIWFVFLHLPSVALFCYENKFQLEMHPEYPDTHESRQSGSIIEWAEDVLHASMLNRMDWKIDEDGMHSYEIVNSYLT